MLGCLWWVPVPHSKGYREVHAGVPGGAVPVVDVGTAHAVRGPFGRVSSSPMLILVPSFTKAKRSIDMPRSRAIIVKMPALPACAFVTV